MRLSRATRALTAGAVLSAAVASALVLQAAATAGPPAARRLSSVRPSTRVSAQMGAVTFAENRAAARSAAAHLLSVAEPPPGSVRVAAAPARLTRIVIDLEVPDFVDDHAFWTVRLPVDAVLAFMGDHASTGFSETGASYGGGPDATRTLTFTENTARAWGTVQSEVAVSRLTVGSSGIRIDDVAEWLDPGPEPDGRPGL